MLSLSIKVLFSKDVKFFERENSNYPHGQLGTQVPNKYFNYCKVILQLQQYFNHYSTPMNNINGKFGIITVVCCFRYIHPSS